MLNPFKTAENVLRTRRAGIFAAILLAAIKLAGDIFFYFFSLTDGNTFFAWKTISSIFIAVFVILIFYSDFLGKRKEESENPAESYFNQIKMLIIFSLVLFISSFFLSRNYDEGYTLTNFPKFIYSDLVSGLAVFCGFYGLNFLFRTFWYRRRKATITYIRIFWALLIFLLVVDFFKTMPDFSYNSNAGNVFEIIATSLTILLAFFVTKKNNWVAYLPKSKKWKLILLSVIIIIIAFIIQNMTSDYMTEGKLHSAIDLFFGASVFLKFPFLIVIGYFTRIMFTAFSALPTSGIVEKRSYDLSSLTYLNRMISRTVDTDSLLETVTKLAMTSSGATSAWTEVYTEDGSISIISHQKIEIEKVITFHGKSELKNYFINLKEPLFIETVNDCKDNLLGDVCRLLGSKSLIAIPLFAGSERFGTLVVLHPEEYSFEKDYINILTAFSDNVNIALENARLIEESIVKERYKKEMFLAMEIEQKLLPHELPYIPNFSVAAHISPAEEVGGDYYDVVKLRNGQDCILIGDVAGKGMSAAFYMALLKGAAMAAAQESNSASEILSKINSALFPVMEKQIFITLSAITINTTEGDISYARAGHLPAVFKTAVGIEYLTPGGIGIGLANSQVFDPAIREIDLKLKRGDFLLLYTDGVSEQKNSAGAEFGENNLKQILENSVYNTANEIIGQIKDKIAEFSRGVTQKDDITILAVFYEAGYNEINNRSFEVQIPSTD